MPLLLNNGYLSLWLDKATAKKCYFLSAWELDVRFIDTGTHEKESFASLLYLDPDIVSDIRGKISTSMLSPLTTYEFNFIFAPSGFMETGFHDYALEVTFNSETHTVFLNFKKRWFVGEEVDPDAPVVDDCDAVGEERKFGIEGEGGFNRLRKYLIRGRLTEFKLGEYFTGEGDDEVSFKIVYSPPHLWDSYMILIGVEMRPKREKSGA